MDKTVFMFPGQGAQYIGMGKDFYENIPICKKIFEIASDVTGLDIAKLCFEENEQIHITEFTQIAMLTVEAAIFEALEVSGKKPKATAGLSLGEYGALIASKVLEPEDAFKVVRQRGIFMQEAVPTGGAMSAILGLDAEAIEKVCENTKGLVSIANYNCPGQIVITGEEEAVALAGEACKAAGAKRALPLKVSGPFHSEMLTGAGEKLGKVLEETKVREFAIPYVADEVNPLLIKQVASSVRWQQSMERLIADGYNEFVEIGPGHTLTGFMRKINRDIKTVNIEKLEDFKAYVGE